MCRQIISGHMIITPLATETETNVSTNNFRTHNHHTARDKTETENNTTIFYNHAIQEIATEHDVSSFTATAKLKGVGENNVSTDNFPTNDHHIAGCASGVAVTGFVS